MKLVPFLALAASYASYSFAQQPSTSDTEIMTIQPVTPILPSSLVTRTSTRLGGSQVEPTSFSTSRLTISDVSTDRPTPTTASGSVTTIPSASATSPTSGSAVASASSAASSPTATSNAALEHNLASPIGLLGILVALSSVILL
ncbi:unnamed protein product [Rhizoctonia solani]|uniref:Uncharacterized protein n=1 Tax=Rhizoctonia solani TaxID=456999 RepID=A0A8H3E9C4_9AGAM|nr:unnamed protein product [Rhizoctonia solani]